MADITVNPPAWATFDSWLPRFEEENTADLSGITVASASAGDERCVVLWNAREGQKVDKYLLAGFSHAWEAIRTELLSAPNNPNSRTITSAHMASSAQLSGDWSLSPGAPNYWTDKYAQAKTEAEGIANGIPNLTLETVVTCELGEGTKRFPDSFWVIFHHRKKVLERLGSPPVSHTNSHTEYGNGSTEMTKNWMVPNGGSYDTNWNPMHAQWTAPTVSQSAARNVPTALNFHAYFNQVIDGGKKLMDVTNGVIGLYMSFDQHHRDFGTTFHYNVEQFYRAAGTDYRKLMGVTWNNQQSNLSFVDQRGRADWMLPVAGGYVVTQPAIPVEDPEVQYKIFLLLLLRCQSVLPWDGNGTYVTDTSKIKLSAIDPSTNQPVHEDPYFISTGGTYTFKAREYSGPTFPDCPLVATDCLVAAMSVYNQIRVYVINAAQGGEYCVYRVSGGATRYECTGRMSSFGNPQYGVLAPNYMAFYNAGVAMKWVWNNKILVVYHNDYLPYALDSEGGRPAIPGEETVEFQHNGQWYGPKTIGAGEIKCFVFDIFTDIT